MKISILIFAIIISSCCSNNSKQMTKKDLAFVPSSKVLIYKTKSDFFYNVPIILSENKNDIISYPHPSDLKSGDGLRLPNKLLNGYLLDNRGISKNVAFIKLTYQEYSELEKPPTLVELKEMILDDDPLLELYDCGYRSEYKDIIQELNSKISGNKISEYKKLK